MTNFWNNLALTARIANNKKRLRYPAGSPDNFEILAYESALYNLKSSEKACILGMTPELRNLAAKRFTEIITVDNNSDAVTIYSDWLEPSFRKREKIFSLDWFDFLPNHSNYFDAILGDGIFGNLINLENHRKLLFLIAHSLKKGGVFVTRMALIPNNFQPELYTWRILRDQFRSNILDESEFGFGVRLIGHYSCCYNPKTFTLDNTKLYNECEHSFNSGELTREEYLAIQRYYFSGSNCIISQKEWESLISTLGYFEVQQCKGKQWYDYYLVYKITFDL